MSICKIDSHEWLPDYDEIHVTEYSAIGTLDCAKCNCFVDIRWKYKSGKFNETGCSHEMKGEASRFETSMPRWNPDSIKCLIRCEKCDKEAEFVYEFEEFEIFDPDNESLLLSKDMEKF